MTGPTLSIVCSDQARNGKTLLAWLFADYLVHAGHSVFTFDLDYPDGRLASLFAGHSRILDLPRTRDQMKLFDTVMSSYHNDHIVDLPRRQLDEFFHLVDEINFARAAEESGVGTTIFFICDQSVASISHARHIHSKLPKARFIIVRNDLLPAYKLDAEMASICWEICGSGPVVLPKLNPRAMDHVISGQYTFAHYLHGEKPIIPLKRRRAIDVFFQQIHEHFEDLRLRFDIEHLRRIGVV